MLPLDWKTQISVAKTDYEKMRYKTEFLVLPVDWAFDLQSLFTNNINKLFGVELLFGYVEKPIACGRNIN